MQIDVTNLLLTFSLLMLLFWGVRFMLRMWKERRERLSRVPPTVRRPKGYGGATTTNYSEHPDAEVERNKREAL